MAIEPGALDTRRYAAAAASPTNPSCQTRFPKHHQSPDQKTTIVPRYQPIQRPASSAATATNHPDARLVGPEPTTRTQC